MTWTLTTSGSAIFKAGANANSNVIVSGTILSKWSDEAEAQISFLTRYDWVANYNSVGANYKEVLSDACSDLIANRIINYDLTGYPRLLEAQTMLDVNRDNFTRIITELKDKKNQEVIV